MNYSGTVEGNDSLQSMKESGRISRYRLKFGGMWVPETVILDRWVMLLHTLEVTRIMSRFGLT